MANSNRKELLLFRLEDKTRRINRRRPSLNSTDKAYVLVETASAIHYLEQGLKDASATWLDPRNVGQTRLRARAEKKVEAFRRTLPRFGLAKTKIDAYINHLNEVRGFINLQPPKGRDLPKFVIA